MGQTWGRESKGWEREKRGKWMKWDEKHGFGEIRVWATFEFDPCCKLEIHSFLSRSIRSSFPK